MVNVSKALYESECVVVRRHGSSRWMWMWICVVGGGGRFLDVTAGRWMVEVKGMDQMQMDGRERE